MAKQLEDRSLMVDVYIHKENEATYKKWIQIQIYLATAVTMSLLMKYRFCDQYPAAVSV